MGRNIMPPCQPTAPSPAAAPRIWLLSCFPTPSVIYQNSRFADFLIENGGQKMAIEIALGLLTTQS